MLQMHPRAAIVCDEDATLELRVTTVKYFKGLEHTWGLKDKGMMTGDKKAGESLRGSPKLSSAVSDVLGLKRDRVDTSRGAETKTDRNGSAKKQRSKK